MATMVNLKNIQILVTTDREYNMFKGQQIFVDTVLKLLFYEIILSKNWTVKKNTCIIPTVSFSLLTILWMLDVANGTQNLPVKNCPGKNFRRRTALESIVLEKTLGKELLDEELTGNK
jgi:hypothetical protein